VTFLTHLDGLPSSIAALRSVYSITSSAYGRGVAAALRFNVLECVGNFIKHHGKFTKHLHLALIIRYRGCQTIVLCSSEEFDRCDVFEWANFGRRFHSGLPVFGKRTARRYGSALD
jgi:hypothetical protein